MAVLVTSEEVAAPAAATEAPDRSFLRWGAGTYLVVVGVLLALALRTTGGRLIYVLDDPAIHLSVAGNLVHHGTWGVEAGRFASASSSPLWTLLLAGTMVVSPLSDALGPLVLNVAGALAVIAVLGANQTVLRPSRRRPLDAAAVAVLVVVVLFLPALTLVGMEHTLHAALALGAVVLVHRATVGEGIGRWPAWAPYALVALATFTRLETVFVAAGLAVAMVARTLPGWGRGGGAEPLRAQLKPVALLGLATAVPVAVVGLTSKLGGDGWMPNSVLAKAQADPAAQQHWFVRAAADRLTGDALLTALVLLALGALVLAWRQPRRFVVPAVVFAVASLLHVGLARMGWYDRYQAYLLVLGTYAALQIAAEALPPERRAARPAALPLLVLGLLLLSATKMGLTTDAPSAVDDTYTQRYQAGRFLQRYYQGEPIATGELGYVTLLHDGPVTDLLGLGDHEVLEERRATDNAPPMGYWERLTEERGFDVAAVYPATVLFQTPPRWILVGEWTMSGRSVSAFQDTFQFWATSPDAVGPLRAHLREFEDELPERDVVTYNDMADLQAALIEDPPDDPPPAP